MYKTHEKALPSPRAAYSPPAPFSAVRRESAASLRPVQRDFTPRETVPTVLQNSESWVNPASYVLDVAVENE
jgi:hypothetical protein